jgi:hypothetical protein
MKFITIVLSLSMASGAFADHHETSYAGMNLEEGNALQMQLCKLKPRKTMADYDRLFNAYIKWSKDNNAETFALRATPVFGGADAGAATDYEWIDMLASSFETSGNGWEKWLNTPSGQKLNAQWQTIADCRVSLNTIFLKHVDRPALSGDTRVMTFNWCTRKEGVSTDQLLAKHNAMLASRADDSPVAAWSIVYPGLGQRNAPGDFAHVLSFKGMGAALAFQDGMANAQGWRQRQDYTASYAKCTGENAYHVQVLNRP